MDNKLLALLFSISLKARILRAWQKSTKVSEQEFTERDLFSLELIQDYPPMTEKGLCKIFGLSPSSVSDIVKNLCEKGLIDTSEKSRGKPLELTPEGVRKLNEIKQTSSQRFSYLFDSSETLTEAEINLLMNIFRKVEKNADQCIKGSIFW